MCLIVCEKIYKLDFVSWLMRRDDKKGATHIETILAFVIFIGFLGFAFYFFSPFESNRTLDTTLEYVCTEIERNTSVELESYSVVIDEGFESIVRFGISSDLLGVRVEDYDGVKLPAKYESGNVVVDRGSNSFLNVIFGEEFTNDEVSGGIPLPAENYTISSSEKLEVFSESMLLGLSESYNDDYVGLGEAFNIPRRVDFDFRVAFDEGGEVVAEREIPEGLEVTSKVERVEILRTSGEIVFSSLRVKVW